MRSEGQRKEQITIVKTFEFPFGSYKLLSHVYHATDDKNNPVLKKHNWDLYSLK